MSYKSIEEILYYAVAENKIDESIIRNSKEVHDQLTKIRVMEEASNATMRDEREMTTNEDNKTGSP